MARLEKHQIRSLGYDSNAHPGLVALVCAIRKQAAFELRRVKRPCDHRSELTPDGYGSYCRVCGETLA